MKAVAVLLEIEIERTVCEVSSGNHDMHVLAVGVLEITTILERDSDIRIFLETFCSMEVELIWMGL